MEVRKRFLILIHICLFWVFLQFSQHICSLSESEMGHGIAQSSDPFLAAPLTLAQFAWPSQEVKTGSCSGVGWIKMWRKALDVLSWEQSSVHTALGWKVKCCTHFKAPGWTWWLDWAMNCPSASSQVHKPHVKTTIYKHSPGRSSTFLTLSSMDYFFWHHSLPSCRCLETPEYKHKYNSKSWKRNRILLILVQRTGLRHLSRKSFEENIHYLCPCLMLFVWKKQSSNSFSKNKKAFSS